MDKITGKGLGLRREFIEALLSSSPDLDFLEVAPENWIGLGGKRRALLQEVATKYPFVAHGLCLSIGAPTPIDFDYLAQLKDFLETYQVEIFSDHLSYCSDKGYFYDLLPLPFCTDAVLYVSERIRQVQDFLERPIAIENISYYSSIQTELTEIDFIKAILQESECQLLLDVNNVYVNSINHGYDAKQFIDRIPSHKIAYIHVAGHEVIEENLILDTHGSEVVEPVWQLLKYTYNVHGVKPTLLERDSDVPELPKLLNEVQVIQKIQEESCVYD